MMQKSCGRGRGTLSMRRMQLAEQARSLSDRQYKSIPGGSPFLTKNISPMRHPGTSAMLGPVN